MKGWLVKVSFNKGSRFNGSEVQGSCIRFTNYNGTIRPHKTSRQADDRGNKNGLKSAGSGDIVKFQGKGPLWFNDIC